MILGKAGAGAELGGFPHNTGMGPSCLHSGKFGITGVRRTARTVPLLTIPWTLASSSCLCLAALSSFLIPLLPAAARPQTPLPPHQLSLCLVSSERLGHSRYTPFVDRRCCCPVGFWCDMGPLISGWIPCSQRKGQKRSNVKPVPTSLA